MRQVLVSGEFDINEVSNNANAQGAQAVTPTKKAQERIDALKAAGVDTSNLYALGENMVVRLVDGKAEKIEDDDPIYKAIKEQGFVPDRRLFRRWVLAQTFYMLRHDYTRQMHNKGYEYTWKMVEEELRVQSKLYGHDNENFAMRNHFFNKQVVVAMAHEYMDELHKYIDGLKTRKCKGNPYKRFQGNDVFVDDLQKKVYLPIEWKIRCIESAKTPRALYEAVSDFNANRVRLHWETRQSGAWVDAYKGAGAYYSMQNLIRFHGMKLRNDNGCIMLKGEKAIDYLNSLTEVKEGWELLGILKEALDYNHIDIDKKMASWQKK